MGWGPLSSILSDAAVVLHSRVRSSYGLLGEAGQTPASPTYGAGHPFSIFTQTDRFSLRQSDLCGQAHLFPETLVERRLGNEAPKQTDLAGSPACGVAAVRVGLGRGLHYSACDQLRRVRRLHPVPQDSLGVRPCRLIDVELLVGLLDIALESSPGVGGLDQHHSDPRASDLMVQGLGIAFHGVLAG